MNRKLFKKSFVGFMVLTIFLWPFAPMSASPATNKIAADDDLLLKKLQVEWIENTAGETRPKQFIADDFKKAKAVDKPEKLNYVPGEILVKFKSKNIDLRQSLGRQKAGQFAANKNLEKKEDIRKSNVSVLKIKGEESVESVIDKLKYDPNVEYAQPNFQYYPLSIDSNDTYKGLLWGLDNTGQEVNTVTGTPDADIDAPEAWAISEGGENEVVAAVIDDGVAYNHPDLVANMWNGSACLDENGASLNGCNHGYDYEDNDKTPLPTTGWHGTHIAGTIAAVKNNSKGIIGVAPQTKIMAIKSSLTTTDNVKSINFAKNNGAKAINASWGGGADNCSEVFDSALYEAIQNFDGLFIAAAGNGGKNHDGSTYFDSPSDYGYTTSRWTGLDNVISVAATDQNDALATFSDYGATSVDVGAPGVNIYSTIIVNSNVLFETFGELTPPNIPSDWVKTGDNNNWRTFDRTALFGSAWGNVLYGDLNYPYSSNMDTTVTSPFYNLNGATEATIYFWTKCDTSYHLNSEGTIFQDYMALEVSMDGVDFVELKKWNEFSIDIDNQSGEDSTGWASAYYGLLIPDNYLTSNFKFRLRWVTDGVDNNYDGCLVDDINITKYSDGSDEQYGFSDGTSMATPHVAGLAALIWGYKPDLTYSQVKDVILSTGDSLASLVEKTVTGKRINAFNALNSLTPPVISDVQTATTTPTSTFVIWSTDKPATSKVAYSTTTPVSSTIVPDEILVTDHSTDHSIELTELTASTTYYFYTESTDEYGNTATSTEQSFTTPAIPDTIALVVIITSPEDGLITNQNPITLNWTVNGEEFSEEVVLIEGENILTKEAVDEAGNIGSDSITIILDTTFPARGSGSPTGALPAGTVETTLSLITDEDAVCRYATTTDIEYNAMAGVFGDTGSTTHSTLITVLTGGSVYAYYVKCQDELNNANTDDYEISFSVSNPAPVPTCGDGTCNGGETCSSCPGDCGSCSSSGGGGGGGGGTPADTTAPAKPSQFIASRKAGSITLTWVNPAASDFYKVIIIRDTKSISNTISGNTLRNYGAVVYDGNLNTYEDKAIKDDIVYYYAVSAYDNSGNYSQPTILTIPTAGSVGINKPAVEEKVEVLGVEADYRAIQLNKILNEAGTVYSGDVNLTLGNTGKSRNSKSELEGYNKYTNPLIKGFNLQPANVNAITNFIVYGMETTQVLGVGERAGVLNSYKSAFGKLPATQSEWEDAIKIANGRWPTKRSEQTEKRAKAEFKKVYLRDPNMNNPNDNAAVTVIAYGLRPDSRNLNSEKIAIKTFKAIYGYNPSSAVDWDIARAIAYSGAKR